MIRRPPRSTRTDTLFPYTTLFRSGRRKIGEQLVVAGTSFEQLSKEHQRPIYSALDQAPASNARPVVVADKMDVHAATLKALDILQKSLKGYFLVVEWDAHTDDPRVGLQNIMAFDKPIYRAHV